MATQQQETNEEGRNRRVHERVRVTKPVKLEATLRGRFIDIMRLEMTGVTIDMSDGGFCANVDQSISPGVRCRVELADTEGGEPKSFWGKVRRTTSGKNGFIVALEFDEPEQAVEALGDDAEDGESAVIEVAEENEDEGGDEDSDGLAAAAPKKPWDKNKKK